MNTKKFFLIVLLAFGMWFVNLVNADAFWGTLRSAEKLYEISKITRRVDALPESEIIKLSKISDETKGTVLVKKIIGKRNLPKLVQIDTYIRIAIYQGKISRKEAEEMFKYLQKVPGFNSALSKIIGNSTMKSNGHLNELRLALEAAKRRYKVVAIGQKFIDKMKKAPTDIDLILKKKNKLFVIESKDYASTTNLPLDKFRADLNTLVNFKKEQAKENTILIFSISNVPRNRMQLKLLTKAANQKNVQLLFGKPEEIIHEIDMLGEIL